MSIYYGGEQLEERFCDMYEMITEIPFTRTGPDSRLKLHEAVGMMMDC